MSQPEIRSVPESDAEAAHELRRLAFGHRRGFDPEAPTMPPEAHVGAYDRDRLVGTTATHRFRQWFGGRAVPCGGVAGVTVAPDHRGRGLARAMMRESFRRMIEGGEVISALFPTTTLLYRSCGYEVAGWWARRSIPVDVLPAPDPDLTWEPVGPDDPALRVAYEGLARGRDGWVVPTDDLWWEFQAHTRRAATPPGWYWAARRDGEVVSALGYGTASSERGLYDLELDVLSGATDPTALRGMFGFLATNGTTVDRIHTSMPMPVLETVLDRPERIGVDRDWPWMLRLVDLPGAIAARGYPTAVEAELHLSVADPVLAGNDGRWVLTVSAGSGSLAPGGEGRLEIAVSDLARCYGGGVDPAALVAAGRLDASDEEVATLRAVFAGCPSNPIFF